MLKIKVYRMYWHIWKIQSLPMHQKSELSHFLYLQPSEILKEERNLEENLDVLRPSTSYSREYISDTVVSISSHTYIVRVEDIDPAF